MRRDKSGCTDKCRLRNKLIECDLARHKEIVNALIPFVWCSECMQTEPGAVKSVC